MKPNNTTRVIRVDQEVYDHIVARRRPDETTAQAVTRLIAEEASA